jgi:hypothetical protein
VSIQSAISFKVSNAVGALATTFATSSLATCLIVFPASFPTIAFKELSTLETGFAQVASPRKNKFYCPCSG